MRFVVVTGMSGSGKRTAMKMLEDVGFYCVDNLPVPLIEKFVELIAMPSSEITKVARGPGRACRSAFWRRAAHIGQAERERVSVRDSFYGGERSGSFEKI